MATNSEQANALKYLKGGDTATRPKKVRGNVKDVKPVMGYGFITMAATGEDYFFHRSELIDCTIEDLERDQQVLFEPSEGPKGPRAMAVELA